MRCLFSTAAVQSVDDKVTDKEIRVAIQDHLKYAPDRSGGGGRLTSRGRHGSTEGGVGGRVNNRVPSPLIYGSSIGLDYNTYCERNTPWLNTPTHDNQDNNQARADHYYSSAPVSNAPSFPVLDIGGAASPFDIVTEGGRGECDVSATVIEENDITYTVIGTTSETSSVQTVGEMTLLLRD
jgi:hypothetical protein